MTINYSTINYSQKNIKLILTAIFAVGFLFSTLSSSVALACCCPPVEPTYSISGIKFNDENGSGLEDCSGESGLQGWTIAIEGPEQFSSSTTTDEQGYYEFSDLSPGSYTLCEVQQAGWQQTYPVENNGCHLIEIEDDNKYKVNFGNQQIIPQATTIFAYKIVCPNEADLPNWGTGGNNAPSMIDEDTANQFLIDHPDCYLEPAWDFQWGFHDKQCSQGVDKLNGDHIGPADGTESSCSLNCGPNTNTGTGYNDWKNFDSSTSQSTPALAEISDLENAPGIWVRENLKEGYIPFTYPPQGDLENDFSAEMYCYKDIYKYDNYDLISSPELGETYYCLAFNALISEPEPEPYCGDGILGDCEECDEGENNDLECTPEYGDSCTYCSLDCQIIEVTGPYCGDGILDQGYETCDDGNNIDGDDCSATCQIEGEEPEDIQPGDIVINEIMQNPAVVNDPYGEWFELYNATGTVLDLNGCVIKDIDTDSHTIGSSLIIPAGGYAVLARNGDSSQNGSTTPDYVYASFTLGNEDDEIILECNSIEIDRVEYDDGTTFPDPDGASMILAYPSLDNNDGANWCESSSLYGDGDLGTPGSQNDSCQEIEGRITGCKYNDANTNSLIEQEEEKLGGWTIVLEQPDGEIWQEVATTTTQLEGENLGCYLFDQLAAGSYRVSESLEGQTDWLQTYPTSTPYWEVSLESGQTLSEIDFANYYLSCQDNDGDGYYAYDEVYCPEGDDCNDANPEVNPGATEICDNQIDDDCDSYVDGDDSDCPEEEEPTPTNGGGGGGGGGGGLVSLRIFNEKNEEISSNRVIVSWFTNKLASSRVIYDMVSHSSLISPPNYGYASSTLEDLNKVTFREVTISNLTPCTSYYWLAISHGSAEVWGDEMTFTTECPLEEIIEEEVIEEGPVEEEITEVEEEIAEVEEVIEEIYVVAEEEKPELPELEEPKEEEMTEEVKEEKARGLLAAIGSIFQLENFCWFFLPIVIILIILYLLSEVRKERKEIKEEKKKWWWIFPLILIILIILYCYFCCSSCWFLLLVTAILVILFLLFRKKKEKGKKI